MSKLAEFVLVSSPVEIRRIGPRDEEERFYNRCIILRLEFVHGPQGGITLVLGFQGGNGSREIHFAAGSYPPLLAFVVGEVTSNNSRVKYRRFFLFFFFFFMIRYKSS